MEPGQERRAHRGTIMGIYSTVTWLGLFAAPFADGVLFAVRALAGSLGVPPPRWRRLA